MIKRSKKQHVLKALNLLLVLAMMMGGVALNVSPVQAAVSNVEIYLPTADSSETVKSGGELDVTFTVTAVEGDVVDFEILLGTTSFTGTFTAGTTSDEITETIVVPTLPEGNYDLQVKAKARTQTVWIASPIQASAVIVDNTPPATPELTAPDGGESWKIATNHNIIWKAANGVGDYVPGEDVTISLYYSANGGGAWSLIADDVEVSSGIYDWTILSVVTTQALVKIVVTDDAGNTVSNQSDAVFTIYGVDNTPPTVTMTAPTGSPDITGETTLEANATDVESGIAGVLFQYSLDVGESWLDAGAGSLVGASWQLVFNTASLPDGAVQFRAIATNGVGLTKTSTAEDAVIDNTDPEILSFNLADGDWVGAGFTFEVTASDAHSGIAKMDLYQFVSGAWKASPFCSDTPAGVEGVVYTLTCDTTSLDPLATQIKAVVTDKVELTADLTHAVQVDLVAPTGTDGALLTPDEGDVLHLGDPLEVTWTAADIEDDNAFVIDLELRVGTEVKAVIASGEANDGSYDWVVAGVPWADNYKVCLVATDEAGNTADDCNTPITIWGSDLTPPVVTLAPVTSPNKGSITLSATASDPESGIDDEVDFFVKPEGGDYPTTPLVLVGSEWDTTEEEIGGEPVYADGVYIIKAEATNGAGVTGAVESDPILIDNTDPTIDNISKAGNVYSVSASDAGSGIASVVFEYCDDYNDSTGECDEWVAIGAGVLNPVSGKYESPAWENVDGVDVRAVATDNVGLTNSANYAPDANIGLVEGWNLISLPLIPDTPAIDDLLADLIARGSVEQVVAWPHVDGALADEAIRWNEHSTQLSELEDGAGYWVEMSQEDVLKFDGSVLPAPPQAPKYYVVYAGWNLIGFKSQHAIDRDEYLGEAGGSNLRMMYGYNEGEGYFQVTDDPQDTNSKLQPGAGYWLAVSTNSTIYPPVGELDQ